LKHFLANSNEKGRTGSSSNFDERLLREYYSVPFRMGVEAGARSYMAAYNGMNGIPMTAQPILKDITIKEWGVNQIITTDAGSLDAMVRSHKYFPDLPTAAAGAIKVAESGIHSAKDIQRLTAAGYDAFLVGEHLMKSGDPANALRALLS